MKESKKEALRWLRQAENDFAYAQIGLRERFYAQVCFQCQQICEKALKAIHYGKLDARVVIGHSLVGLTKELDFDRELLDEMAVLDQSYIPTRHPNGLPGGTPFEVYTKTQAENAIRVSRSIIQLATKAVSE